jgi:hypothetical protein
MSTNREHWWEDSQNAALVVVALIVAIVILGFIADGPATSRILRLIDSEAEACA